VSETPEIHLNRTIEDERIRNETHIPIDNNDIIQVLRTSIKEKSKPEDKDKEFVIEVELKTVIDISKKEAQNE
jgi:hypothetical protein